MGYSRIYTQGGWGYTFLKKPPGIFRFVTLTLKIAEKKNFHPWKFCKIVWQPLESLSRSKIKTHGNSHEFSSTHVEISTYSLFNTLGNSMPSTPSPLPPAPPLLMFVFFCNSRIYVSSSQNLIACYENLRKRDCVMWNSEILSSSS